MRIVEQVEVDDVAKSEIPVHVGCIMDGNGRWAQMRGLSRSEGHAAAEESVYSTVQTALDLGVRWLTLYAFSTENWRRHEAEVKFLMSFDEWLLRKARRDELHEKGVRILFAGRLDDPRIPARSREYLAESMELTASNTNMSAVIAFNYGGRTEIIDAVNAALADPTCTEVTEDDFSRLCYIPDMPDMDLLVRTSAEERTSGFFPWHATYAEFVFTDTLWPDFRGGHLVAAIAEYQQRRRRKGAAEAT